MTSNIVSTTIDATFPTPGVDNDTQGFRDNFSIIKDNFAAAKAEIDNLQTYTAKLNASNNFDGNNIISGKLQGTDYAVSPLVTIVSGLELPWIEASYYAFTVNADVTLTMSEWPLSAAGILGRMLVQVTAASTSRVVTFDTINGTVKMPTGVNNPVTLSAGATNIYEFWTIDGGSTVYGKLVGSYT